jgi:hypothetical protein
MKFHVPPSHHSSNPLLSLLRSPALRCSLLPFLIEIPAIPAPLGLLQRLIRVLLNRLNVRLKLYEPLHILLTFASQPKGTKASARTSPAFNKN